MNKEELKQQLIDWCHEQGEWQAKEDSVESGTDFVLILRSQAPPAVVLEVKNGSGEDWITLHHALKIPKATVDEPPSSAGETESFPFAELVNNLVDARAALLRGEVQEYGENYLVSLTFPLYLDGLSKHLFLSALQEIVKTRRLVQRVLDEIRQQRQSMAKLQETFEKVEAQRKRTTEAIERAQAVPAQPVPPPVPPTPTERRCARCGHLAPHGKTFCGGCGARL